jgi:hypothetical protein
MILSLLLSTIMVSAQHKVVVLKKNTNDTVKTIEPIIFYGKRPISVNFVPLVSLSYDCYVSCILVGYRVTQVQFIWSPNKIAGTHAGVQLIDGAIAIRGARPDGTAYFIDGIRVRSLD